MKRSRWLSYSLRGLLVVMTLFCLGFGLLGRLYYRAQQQKLAVAKLRNIDVTDDGNSSFAVSRHAIVSYANESRIGKPDEYSPWLRPAMPYLEGWFGFDAFHEVETVDLRGRVNTDETLWLLRATPGVKQLNITDTSITNKGLAILPGLRLRILQLNTVGIDEGCLTVISRIGTLEELNIHNTTLTNEGIAKLQKLPLRVLNFGTPSIDNDSLALIAKIGTLEDLRLTRSQIDETGLQHLHKLGNLRYLQLFQHSKLAKESLEELRRALPKCQVIAAPFTW